ncbi:MAG TPA: hypothetical protein EYN38_08825 [Flavobacteriales bacterium]|nr:hypothetical protein [Flavobacteriales bacterium]
MAFLDNSGDIILDAVLTDTGRMRLAKGDGSFRIVKFAFGDDEIDYSTYNKNHASGSAYYDIEILQSPVLEAFTNNTSLLKSRLLSIPRNNLLYLPILKVNEVFDSATKMSGSGGTSTTFIVAVDENTENEIFQVKGQTNTGEGIIKGELGQAGAYVRVDQGLDTSDIPPGRTLDADLVETQYIIEIDNRFGRLVDIASGSPASVSFIDDDNVASYFLSLGTDTELVQDNTSTDTGTGSGQTIEGPRGTFLKFRIQASLELNTSSYLFTQLGSTTAFATVSGGNTVATMYIIDTIVRVTGATTGQRVDIPVRFVKKQ